MKSVAIIGGGELGIQLLDLLIETGEYQVAGFYDDTIEYGTVIKDNYTILGPINSISDDFKKGIFQFLINAIGYKHMHKRKELFDRYSSNIPFATIIHQTCIVNKSAIIGQGTVLYPGCIIDKNVRIGNNVLLNLGVTVAHDTIVRNHSFLAPRVVISGFVNIHECCFLGTGVIVTDNKTIGKNIVLGAGTVVISNLASNSTYVGNPSRKISK